MDLKNVTITPDFEKAGGLIPAIAQDYQTGEVLMLAYMNRESYEKTLSTGEVHYYSRSRQELWHKGGSSGNVQKLKALYLDCDFDTILLKIEQIGNAACHTGRRTCFHYKLDDKQNFQITGEVLFDPRKVYKK